LREEKLTVRHRWTSFRRTQLPAGSAHDPWSADPTGPPLRSARAGHADLAGRWDFEDRSCPATRRDLIDPDDPVADGEPDPLPGYARQLPTGSTRI